MAKYYVLYNAKSGNGTGLETAKKLEKVFENKELEYVDIIGIKDYKEFFAKLGEEDRIVICGGDGTLSRFANDTYGIQPDNCILFYSSGSGNDFLRDLGKEVGADPVAVNKYITDLPTVTVNGKDYKFINGIGYGIDGYCCEEGDRLRALSDKPINYTSIAIKGLLFHYKPTNAEITVDGVTKKFKKVWLAPTMNGRFFGGGMMPTPDQDRLNNETVSTMVMYGKGKIRTLMMFPSIFKGEHVNYKNAVEIFTGKQVTVKFDRPTP